MTTLGNNDILWLLALIFTVGALAAIIVVWFAVISRDSDVQARRVLLLGDITLFIIFALVAVFPGDMSLAVRAAGVSMCALPLLAIGKQYSRERREGQKTSGPFRTHRDARQP